MDERARGIVRGWIASRLAPEPDIESEWIMWQQVEEIGLVEAFAAMSDLTVEIAQPLGQLGWVNATREAE